MTSYVYAIIAIILSFVGWLLFLILQNFKIDHAIVLKQI